MLQKNFLLGELELFRHEITAFPGIKKRLKAVAGFQASVQYLLCAKQQKPVVEDDHALLLVQGHEKRHGQLLLSVFLNIA